jgi:hypothetical protein
MRRRNPESLLGGSLDCFAALAMAAGEVAAAFSKSRWSEHAVIRQTHTPTKDAASPSLIVIGFCPNPM